MSDTCRLPESGRASDDTNWNSGRRKAKGIATNAPSKLMSLIASFVSPGDEEFLRRIDAMYSTAKDSMEEDDEASDEADFIMGDLVDELVLDDLNADDKQDFRMVSDAVQKRRIKIERVQQIWQTIKKNLRGKAKAKAKAKGQGKGKFLRPRMLPRKRPRAPDESRVPGPEADDQNVGMEGECRGLTGGRWRQTTRMLAWKASAAAGGRRPECWHGRRSAAAGGRRPEC